jgi:hypothetical protein
MYWFCAFQVAELCTKCWDLCYNPTMNGSVWALKRCKNCTNEVFHLTDTAILHYLFTSQPLCNLFIFRMITANLSLCLSKHYKVNKNRDIAWNIINVGTKQRWVVSFILQILYPWHPLRRRLCMLQTSAGLWKERPMPCCEHNRDFPLLQPTIPSLYMKTVGGGGPYLDSTALYI